MHDSTYTFRTSLSYIVLAWVLLGLPIASQAQSPQIDQVSSQTSASDQQPVQVQKADPVTRSDALSLIPGVDPIPSATGKSGIVVQKGTSNDAVLQQNGAENKAVVSQRRWQGAGGNNTAQVTQRNRGNLAVVVQQGQLNETTVTQRGTQNRVGVRLRGNNNQTNILQQGTGNEYLLDFKGNGLGANGTHTVKQIGNQNTLKQVGRGSKPVNVRQRGNGMKVLIRHTP